MRQTACLRALYCTSAQALPETSRIGKNRRLARSIASNNVKKLREAFEDFVSGKLPLDCVNSLLADFDPLLSIAEKLKG